ncbi:MAG TPA: DUF58 domain-containing protein, partial [Spirochaetia bacterium]|nr:DUF58 domain-containing protein [Spirochaetia bacterium]
LALALIAPVFALRFISFFVFFLLLAALGYNRLVVRSIEIRRPDRELRGSRRQSMISRTVLRNPLPIPIPRLSLIETPGQFYCDRPSAEFTLAPGGSETHVATLRGEHRGEFSYGPARIHGSDLFGFFHWERTDPVRGRAIVFPHIYPIFLQNRQGVAGGSLTIGDPVYEDVTRFRSLREYAAGDELKRVNWKASAKSGKLYTTEYERTLTAGVKILLNLMEDDYPARKRDQNIERAVEVAAALVFSYTTLGQPVGIVAAAAVSPERAPGQRGTAAGGTQSGRLAYDPKSGWPHSQQLFELLARLATEHGTADYLELVSGHPGGMPTGVRLLLVGPRVTPVQVDQIRTLRARHVPIDFFEVGSGGNLSSGFLDGICRVHRVVEYGEKIVGG